MGERIADAFILGDYELVSDPNCKTWSAKPDILRRDGKYIFAWAARECQSHCKGKTDLNLFCIESIPSETAERVLRLRFWADVTCKHGFDSIDLHEAWDFENDDPADMPLLGEMARRVREKRQLPQPVAASTMLLYCPSHSLNRGGIMLHNEINRRNLLRSAAAGAALGCCGFGGTMSVAADTPSPVKILDPVYGAVLNHRHGKQTKDSLTIHISGETHPGDRVTVNGASCRVEGRRFDANVVLREHETDLVAVATGGHGRCEDRVRVVWDRYSEPRYRFAIDDSSFFLRDIARENHASLFDCFFLKGLRTLHRQYGTKFCVNVYYVACDDDKYPTDADFQISRFPNRYRGEWGDNADWLKLAFHAYANMPPRPYQDASPEKLAADMDLIAAEVRRFAGERTLVPPPNLHYSMSRHSAFKPMYERGVRELSGYFWKSGDKYDINYNWDNGRSAYILQHNVWKDFESGIVFTRDSMVCNSVPVGEIANTLKSLASDPNAAEVINLLTHEQYFWPFYRNYIPDHFERLDTAIRWVTEHGYKPVLYHEGFLGGRA